MRVALSWCYWNANAVVLTRRAFVGGWNVGLCISSSSSSSSSSVTMASATSTKGNTNKEGSRSGEVEACSVPSKEETVLDKSIFNSWLNLLALRVPKQHCYLVSKILTGYLLDMPRLKHIVPDSSNPSARLVLLSQNITDPSLGDIPSEKLAAIKSLDGEVEVVRHNILLDYTYWSVDKVLTEILPVGSEVPSSFETIGHIAHLNLRDELLPYKKLIATVILDKNMPKIQTVVNKVGTICNEFRVPTFEVLSGKESLITEVKQHGATFRLDYGLVYWNSRLEFEHKWLVSQFEPGQVVCDMFAGIGPFAIPAAQRGCVVFANDLNPDSINYLQLNAKVNKVQEKIHIFNMDAREFIQFLMIYEPGSAVGESKLKGVPEGTVSECCLDGGSNYSKEFFAANNEKSIEGKDYKSKYVLNSKNGSIPKPWEHVDHIIMNLPASSLEFLDVFVGLLSRTHWKGNLPQVHCYCFMRSNETAEDVIQCAERILKSPLVEPHIWTVRDVAPNKVMLCLSFYLPEVAFKKLPVDATQCQESISSGFKEEAWKRLRVD